MKTLFHCFNIPQKSRCSAPNCARVCSDVSCHLPCSLLGCRGGIFFGFVGGLMSKIDMSRIPAGIWNEDMRARTPCCLLRSDNGPSKDDSSEDSGLSESGGGAWPPQILTDQLTLSNPWWADYAIMPTIYYWHPRIFRPSYGPTLRYFSPKHLELWRHVNCWG